MMSGFPFLTALFALSAATAWGSGDFTGGMASRRVGTFRTVLISYTVGLLALVLVALAYREVLPSPADALWGALAGILGMVGLVCLLRGFAVGRMGIVAPVSATLATALPVVLTLFTRGLPRAPQLVGFGLAVAGIWLLSSPETPAAGRPAGLGLALLAGLGFGSFFIALDQVGAGAVFWPLVAGRLACCALMLAFAAATRRPLALPRARGNQRSLLWVMALAGMLDVSGNLFFLLAVQAGRLDVATVLSSLYPAVTTLLAWLLARERMAAHQLIGVAAAVVAIVLITI
jgi:drug/metabolite transporter (DMT)-like permease